MASLTKPTPPAAKEVSKEGKKVIPMTRTSAGLRSAIFDEIDAIRNGTSSPTRANAVAKLAATVVETVRVDIEIHRYVGQAMGAKAAAGIKDVNLEEPLELE